MSDDAPPRGRRTRDRVAQGVGFLIGIALIVWCVRKALGGDGGTILWSQLRAAPAWILVLLGLTTLVSLVANGALFWASIRPLHPLPFRELQAVNLLASVLNYAPLPLRLGLVARAGYHWRVNRMSVPLIGAWFAAVLLSALVAFAAAATALPIAPKAGLGVFAVATLVLAAVGVFLASLVGSWPWLRRRLGGAERLLGDMRAFGSATALRLVDMSAWSARMVIAAKILAVPVTTTEAALLGFAAVVASMNPLGRFGFREAAVAWLASVLFSGRMTGEELEATFARLAIVESAAEGAITIPLGVLAGLWCWRRWRRA